MSETETVLCVVQILLERLSVFVHKKDHLVLYLMLWYAQVVYCNKIEDHIAEETWLYLISRIEISRALENGNQGISTNSKSNRKDILKSVHGNNNKLKRLEEWLPNDAWQNIIELSQELREFYHLPQSILDNDEFRTKMGSVYSWKAWWRDCKSILKSEKYSQIGIDYWNLKFLLYLLQLKQI